MTNDFEMTAYRIMAETGLSARDLAEMDIDAYVRATGRPTPTEAALRALGLQERPAALPDTTFTQQAVAEPQGRTLEELALTDDQMFHAWRSQRVSSGEGIGLLNQSASQSWAGAARINVGRTGWSLSNVVEPPRLTGRYVDPDAQRDTRSAQARFNTPGNSFEI